MDCETVPEGPNSPGSVVKFLALESVDRKCLSALLLTRHEASAKASSVQSLREPRKMSTEDQSASGHGSLENFNIPQAYGELPSDLDDSSNPHQDFSQSQFIPVVEDNTFQGQDFYTGHGPLRFPLQTQGPEPLGSQFIEHHSHPGVDSFDTMAINSLPRDIGTSYHGSHVIPTLPQMAYPHPGLPVEASGLASEDFRRNLAMDAPGDVHSTPGQLMEPHVFPYQHWEHGVPSLGALTSNARPGYIGEPLEEPLTATLNTGTTVPFENSPNERQQYSFSGLGYLNDGVGVIPQTQLDGSSDPADHENYIQLQTHGRTTYVMGTAGMPDARYDRSSHRILHEETSPASPSGPQSWSSSGAAYNGNLGRESGTGTDGYHRLSRGLYLNTQPSPSQGASFENSFLSPQGSFHSPSPHSPPSTGKASGSRRGRKGPLTPEQRAHAKQTREQKACDECHIKKTRVRIIRK